MKVPLKVKKAVEDLEQYFKIHEFTETEVGLFCIYFVQRQMAKELLEDEAR